MMLRKAIAALLLSIGTSSSEVGLEVPIFCRLLSVALQDLEDKAVLANVNVSAAVNVPVIGDANVSVSHLVIDTVKVVDCASSVDEQGRFNVGVKTMDLALKQLMWKFTQLHFPHAHDNGVATADASLSFNVTIDLASEKHQVMDVEVGALKVHLGASNHAWITKAIEQAVNSRVMRKAVHSAAQKAMDKMMATIYNDGACAFTAGALKSLDAAELQFTSYEAMTVHVPLLGNVSISVNSTAVSLPTSMKCNKLAFDGSRLAADVQELPFDADFVWAYQKPNSSFWHNQGTGIVGITAGLKLYIDVVKPSATSIKVILPRLAVKLNADANGWMYKALTAVLAPLIRGAAQTIGGKVLAHRVAKCIADPTCPHVEPMQQALTAPATSEVAMII